jgi:hypothetical protein
MGPQRLAQRVPLRVVRQTGNGADRGVAIGIERKKALARKTRNTGKTNALDFKGSIRSTCMTV